MQFDGFQWDKGNWPKCSEHGLTRPDIEQLFSGECAVYPDVQHSQAEERFFAIGQIESDRWIFAAFYFRREGGAVLIRPISARRMHDREIKRYATDTQSTSDPDQ